MKQEAMRVSVSLLLGAAAASYVLGGGITLLLEHYDAHYLTGFVLTGLTATVAIGLAHFRVVRPLYSAREVISANGEHLSPDEFAQSGLRSHKVVGPFIDRISSILLKFVSVLANVSKIIEKNSISLAETSHKVDQLNKNIEALAGKSREIATAAESISTNTALVSSNAAHAAEFAIKARGDSVAGQSSLKEALAEMRQMSARTEETSQLIGKLQDNSSQIQAITQVINTIAGQINLLALNAAIEAARAGEHGRGFAVVADEVRKLAEKTSAATGEIGGMVTEIHSETERAVATMQSLVEDVNRGVGRVEYVGTQLEGILQHSSNLEDQMRAIADGAEKNHAEVGQISDSLGFVREQLDGFEVQMKTISEQSMALSDLGEGLHESLVGLHLDTIHSHMFKVARLAADEAQEIFAAAVKSGKMRLDDIFDRNYKPIPGTDPQKYNALFDAFTDRILPAIQEKVLQQNPEIIYAITTDNKGYVPTHNDKFAKPPTGNYQTDLANSRSKRIFSDRTGLRCGANTQKMLLQTYKRDTGEIMHDISVPIYIAGKHWGGFRMGYKAA